MLRHAAGSIPVIMTLNSGAALAAASSLLAQDSTSKDPTSPTIEPKILEDGQLVCLHDPPSALPPVSVGGVTKYPQPITGCVIEGDNYLPDNVDAMAVCTEMDQDKVFTGETTGFEYNGQNGLLVSAMAFSSVTPLLGDCRDTFL